MGDKETGERLYRYILYGASACSMHAMGAIDASNRVATLT